MTSADELVLQLLIGKGVVDSDLIGTIRKRLTEQTGNGAVHPDIDVLEYLFEEHKITQQQIAEILAEEFNTAVANLDGVRISPEALQILPYDLAERYRVFPLEVSDNEIVISIFNPLDVDAIDTISHVTQRTVAIQIASPKAIEKAIRQNYKDGYEDALEDVFSDMEDNSDLESGSRLSGQTSAADDPEEAPIIRYVHMVISKAVQFRASDIHMEPLERRFRIRYRIDGVLREMESPPKRLQPSIISRVKLMAGISIAEKRVPLDGRISIRIGIKSIDLRVSTLPTVFGESIVMRILDKEGLNLGLSELGFLSDDLAAFERIITLPDGIFLVTGPTGSGKSTTLYSALNAINDLDRKIITVEDPVEYEIMGINQVQVQRNVGMTFAAALRSMLRQAPNVIMIGEIRDQETAEIAINAALTGHMIFSTLHTNDAPSAISRLVDIGIKPFLVAAALRAVLAQRLVRRICPDCKQSHSPDETVLDSLGVRLDQISGVKFMKGQGCTRCNGSGFRGRLAIFELFSIDEALQQMIYDDVDLADLRVKLKEMGMRNMREDGVCKVFAGMTTVEEILNATVADSPG